MHSGTLSGRCVDETASEATGGPSEPASTSSVTTDVASTGSTTTSSSATTEPIDPESSSSTTETTTMAGDASESDDESSTGYPRLRGAVEFLDDDLAGEFGGGTFIGTAFSGGRLRLADASSTGVFLSRVFDAGAEAQWDQLRWTPDAPYAKPLPGLGGAEVGYAEGNMDMDANALLLRFDEEGALPDGTAIADDSGNAIPAQIVASGAGSESAAGLFGAAIADSLDARVSLGNATELNFADGPFSVSLWFQLDHDCSQDTPFVGVDDVPGNADGEPFLWFGCRHAAIAPCDGGDEPRLAGTVAAAHGDAGEGLTFCDDETFDSGWHQAALVKTGHANAEVRVYLDGQLRLTAQGDLDAPLDFLGVGDFVVGGQSDGAVPSQSVLDEVAIWRRELSADELDALYARGAQRIELEVRVCQLDECADAPPFMGATLGERFRDPASAASPGSGLPLAPKAAGRYVQYRVHLERTALAPTPTLSSVAIAGEYR